VAVKIEERFLREALLARGLSEELVDEVLATVKARSQGRRRRAVLVRSERMSQEQLEEIRREQMLRMAERTFNRQNRPLSMTVLFVSPSRTVTVVRQGEEVSIWDLRPTVVRRRPQTKRLLAQNLPAVKVRSYEVRQIVVSRPDGASVLAFPSGRSGVRLTPDMLRSQPQWVYLRWMSGGRWFQIELPADEWKQVLQTVTCFRKKRKKMEVSADGITWFRVADLIRR